jgi:C-terminal peptidase prc
MRISYIGTSDGEHDVIPRTIYATLCEMEPRETFRRGRSIMARGVSFALVAALAFGAGLFVSGSGSAAAVITHIPLVGDGLDATPDQSVDLTDFWKAWNTLETNYVITHASSTLPSSKERLLGAIEGLASSYGDPYTVFFPPVEAKAFADTISGSFAGVGMEIDVKDNILTVIAPLKGTPAEAAGIKAGDQIAAIDGKSTDGVSTDKAVSQIRGPIGTTVDLTIIRGGKPLDIKIVRQTIQIPETNDSIDAANGVYHIALYEFTSNSANLFDQALTRFQASSSKKLVIDLRGNPGGYLDAAVDIASHFLPKGTKIVTEDFGGKEAGNVHTSLGYDGVPTNTKIVVLIDGGSASASEILAGALQDAHAATLIGTKSFGKGSVQTLIDLAGGSLKITVARWITPAGHWIMGNGITPDITVAYAAAGATTTPKVDPQMARAVQFLTNGK